MAAINIRRRYNARLIRINRIFRDRTNPFDIFDDSEIFEKFRFHRLDIITITESVHAELNIS